MDDRRISYSWGNFSSIDRDSFGDPGTDADGAGASANADAGPLTERSGRGKSKKAAKNSKPARASKRSLRKGKGSGSESSAGNGDVAAATDDTASPVNPALSADEVKGGVGRKGRRNASIRQVDNLGAAAAAQATTASRAAKPDGDLGVETQTAARIPDDEGSLDVGDETERRAETDVEATLFDDSVFDDSAAAEDDDALLDFVSTMPSNDDAVLEIAELDPSSTDNLDLADFVIQAAVSGEDDLESKPQTKAASPAPTPTPAPSAGRSSAGSEPAGDVAGKKASAAAGQAMAGDADEKPASDDGTSDAFGAFGADTTDDGAVSGGSDPSASLVKDESADAPKNLTSAPVASREDRDAATLEESAPTDHRYVSPDLRIPMIDEDDIPSVQAAYEYEAAAEAAPDADDQVPDETFAPETFAPETFDPETEQTISVGTPVGLPVEASADKPLDATFTAALAEEADQSLSIDASDVPPVAGPADDPTALFGAGEYETTDADRTLTFTTESDAAPVTAGSSMEQTAATPQTARAAAPEPVPATPDRLTKSDAGYAAAASGSAKSAGRQNQTRDDGPGDVDASRLFSALSLKRLAIPPHVFEARQRVNIISGLAIIAALGFVGWYFSSPATLERTRLVEAKPPAKDTATARTTPDPTVAGTVVSATAPKTGLIYQPMKPVKVAALTAIGNLEYKITPSKFHRVVRVVKGDTFVKVLVRAGVDAREAGRAIRSMRSIYDPRKLRIGREIKVAFGVAGAEQTKFMGYRFDSSYDRSVHVARQQSGDFAAAEVKKKVDKSFSRVDGAITSSLFGSGMKAGAPAQAMVQMIHLFSFAVDFQRDLRGGETFEILFRSHKDQSGRVVRTGEIVYASLTVRGRTHKLYWYLPTKNGKPEYLNEKGEGNRKALMKTPIDGARLTSNFGYRRHPILGYSKLHTGADFGARTGTPIYAAGDGTIVKIGWHGGYGRYIRIRHGKVYQTAYAHMSRFRGGLKVGSRVKQGETIGYVGSTGRSTGPHLHYEVLKNGKHVNPMTITLPSRNRLRGNALRRFMAYRKKIDKQFAQLKNERQKREDGRVQAVKAEGNEGCKNGIRLNPLDKRPCN